MKTNLIENKVGFISKLFSGNISLPITYWIFYILIGNIGFVIIQKIIELNYLSIVSSPVGVLSIQVFYIVAFLYLIFIIISIWRSAGKYKGWIVWSILSRLVAVLGMLFAIAVLVKLLQNETVTDNDINKVITMMSADLPKMITDETRVDEIYVQNKNFHIDYTLVNTYATKAISERVISLMTPQLKTSQCADKTMKIFLDEGRSLIYTYKDKENNLVAKIVINESDCL